MSRETLRELVEERAGLRCEYCKMHQALQGATFHLEHIIPISKGGANDESNLALACPSCNLKKSDVIAVIDRLTGEIIPLFNPRLEQWEEHFEWKGREIAAISPVASATLQLLDLNSKRRVQIRLGEELLGYFPP